MSTFEVTIETIEVLPHPNADALELARVGGYHAVIPKGKYITGDKVVYIPEQAVLPNTLIAFLGLEGKLSGKDKNRVKPVRLRGELSQGIVMSIPSVKQYMQDRGVFTDPDADITNFLEWATEQSVKEEYNHAGGLGFLLGIEKWVSPIPVEMQGQLVHVNSIVKWPDVENIKKYPNLFEDGEEVFVTEKIHGTCCGISYDVETDTFAVYSKGLSQQGLALVESDTNVYWRAVHRYGLEKKLRSLAYDANAKRIAIFGEVYGQGVQDLGYGVETKTFGPAFGCFDVWVQSKLDGDEGDFLLPAEYLSIYVYSL